MRPQHQYASRKLDGKVGALFAEAAGIIVVADELLLPLQSHGEWTMAGIARPPCDEAAILAGSCQHPVTVNGPWILAATILGSSMAFIDGTVVNVALPAVQSALHATLAENTRLDLRGP